RKNNNPVIGFRSFTGLLFASQYFKQRYLHRPWFYLVSSFFSLLSAAEFSMEMALFSIFILTPPSISSVNVVSCISAILPCMPAIVTTLSPFLISWRNLFWSFCFFI